MNPLIRYECEHCPASFMVREEYEAHYLAEHESAVQLLSDIETQSFVVSESLAQRIKVFLDRSEKS